MESLQRAENKIAERERQLDQEKRYLDEKGKNLDKTLKEYTPKSNAASSPTTDKLGTAVAGTEPKFDPHLSKQAEARELARADAGPSTAQAKSPLQVRIATPVS